MSDEKHNNKILQEVEYVFYKHSPIIAKAREEERRLLAECRRFDQGIAESTKRVKEAKRKTKLALQAKDTFQRKAVALNHDTREIRNELLLLRSKVISNEQDFKNRNAEIASRNDVFRNTENSIEQQIQRVVKDISHFESVSAETCRAKVGVVEACSYAQQFSFDTFLRWLKVWPILQMWITSQSQHVISINAVATLQGLTAEWIALRSMALQITDLDEQFKPTDILHSNQRLPSNPHLALTKLRRSLEKRRVENLAYGKAVTAEVEKLDKLRKHLKHMIFDLEAALDADMRASQKMAENEAVMPINRAILLRGNRVAGSSLEDSLLMTHSHVQHPSDNLLKPSERLKRPENLKAWKWMRSAAVEPSGQAEVVRRVLGAKTEARDKLLHVLANGTDPAALRRYQADHMAKTAQLLRQKSYDSGSESMSQANRSSIGISMQLPGDKAAASSEVYGMSKTTSNVPVKYSGPQMYDTGSIRAMISAAEVRAAARRMQVSALAIGKLSLKKTQLSIEIAGDQQTNVTSGLSAEFTESIITNNPELLHSNSMQSLSTIGSHNHNPDNDANDNNNNNNNSNSNSSGQKGKYKVANSLHSMGIVDKSNNDNHNNNNNNNIHQEKSNDRDLSKSKDKGKGKEAFNVRLREIRKEELGMVDLIMENNTFIQEWISYTNTGVHAAVALQRNFPCAPELLVAEAKAVARTVGSTNTRANDNGGARTPLTGRRPIAITALTAASSGGEKDARANADPEQARTINRHTITFSRSIIPDFFLPGPQNDPDHETTSQQSWGILEFQKAVRIDGDMLNLSMYWQGDLDRVKIIARSFLQNHLEEYVLLIYTSELEEVFPVIKDKGGLVNRARMYDLLLSVLHIEVIGIGLAHDLVMKVKAMGLKMGLLTLPIDAFVPENDSVVRILTIRSSDAELVYCVFPRKK